MNGLILTAEKALARMRTGSVLVHMHTNNKTQRWFVIPGGAVNEAVAETIRTHPLVSGSRDGLFPQHDQTWRMRG
jgi:hypothetical protein